MRFKIIYWGCWKVRVIGQLHLKYDIKMFQDVKVENKSKTPIQPEMKDISTSEIIWPLICLCLKFCLKIKVVYIPVIKYQIQLIKDNISPFISCPYHCYAQF